MTGKMIAWSIGGATAVAACAALWGASLPATTVVERVATLPAPVGEVFQLVTDVAGQATWRTDVGDIEVAADGLSWKEHQRDGSVLAFHSVRREADRLFDIAYHSTRGFEGRWTGSFEATPDGTRVRFVERVTIPNPIGRAIARVVAPPGDHLDLYLADLQRIVRSRVPAPP